MVTRRLNLVLLAAVLACAAGCRDHQEGRFGPPEGWDGTSVRWWVEGNDTTGYFADLETMEAMGIQVPSQVYASSRSTALQSDVGREQVVRAIKRSLIRLYRNDPLIVDSLFERFVAPKIRAADLSGDLSKMVSEFKKQGYDLITNVYREPRAVQQPNQLIYPDSLRARSVSGAVKMQVRVDAEGNPVAVELLQGVHPVLNQIAMEGATEMQWQPAYLMRKGNWRPEPAWVRYTINFRTPE